MIESALDAAKAAAKAASTIPKHHDLGWMVIDIDLSTGRAGPLVRALAYRGIGRVEIRSWSYKVSFRNIVGSKFRSASADQVRAAVETFGYVLIRMGFSLRFITR